MSRQGGGTQSPALPGWGNSASTAKRQGGVLEPAQHLFSAGGCGVAAAAVDGEWTVVGRPSGGAPRSSSQRASLLQEAIAPQACCESMHSELPPAAPASRSRPAQNKPRHVALHTKEALVFGSALRVRLQARLNRSRSGGRCSGHAGDNCGPRAGAFGGGCAPRAAVRRRVAYHVSCLETSAGAGAASLCCAAHRRCAFWAASLTKDAIPHSVRLEQASSWSLTPCWTATTLRSSCATTAESSAHPRHRRCAFLPCRGRRSPDAQRCRRTPFSKASGRSSSCPTARLLSMTRC